MPQKTPLYDCHVKAGAKLVDFSGWDMPLHYGSQIEEHHVVRQSAGLFDVSHMGVVEVKGEGVIDYLRYLLANDIEKLKNPGDALYTCMLNDNGGIIDDLIAYRFSDAHFRLVINAGCREKDIAWLEKVAAQFSVELTVRQDVCLLALQGPNAIDALKHPFGQAVVDQIATLKPFKSLLMEDGSVIARTGYTGEAGVEMMLPVETALRVWDTLLANDVKPCGLGARDTLRLEAGLNLYGNDMTEETSPLNSNLAWTVSFKDESRDFIGKTPLLAQKASGVSEILIGLLMTERGVLRAHQKVMIEGVGEGEITSGTFSPTIGHAIAMARVPVGEAQAAKVERRGDWLPVQIVQLPFVRNGEVLI